jgi:hypothetical protein
LLKVKASLASAEVSSGAVAKADQKGALPPSYGQKASHLSLGLDLKGADILA